MTTTAICPNCQSTASDPITGACAACGSGMLRIPVAQALSDDAQGEDFVILQDSIAPGPRHPPSSTSHAETLILPPDHDRSGSSAIRLGRLPEVIPSNLPSGISSTSKFTLVEELGRGGMGIILRGRDKVLHRDVALKVIRDPGDDLQRERFIKEAQVTGQLEHPNIVPVHEFGVDQNGRIFFAMKLVRGRTLGEILDGHRQGEAAAIAEFPLSRLVTILIQVCHAVAFAHSRGVIHRDLKPSNVMLGDFGEVVLMDWGLAKVGVSGVAEPAQVGDETPSPGQQPTVRKLDDTHDGAVLGTPVYMPPEQALGRIDELDGRSDVYSLGAILYELLTLHTPIEGNGIKDVLHKVVRGEITPPALRAPGRDIPRDLAAVAMKALALEPGQRYGDVVAMRGDLERFLDGRMVSAREDNLMEVLVRFVRRHRIAASTVAATALLLVGVVAFGYLANLDQRRLAEDERQRAEVLRRTAEGERAKALASGAAAERERERATAALRQAEEQRQLADEARARATQALESESRLRLRSELAAHLTALSLASEQVSRRDYGAARTSLDSCPVALRDWSWRRLALLCHRHLLQVSDHIRPVSHLASGSHGRLLASAGEDGTVVVDDLLAHRRLIEIEAQATAIAMAAGSDDLVVAEAVRVRLLATGDGRTLAALALAGVSELAQDETGAVVALGTADGEVVRWLPLTGERRTATRLGGAIIALRLLADGGLLVGDDQGQAVALAADDSLRWQRRFSGRILAWSAQGLALVLERDGHATVHDAASGAPLGATAVLPPGVAAGAFSSDGLRFALAGDDRIARVFDSVDGRQVIALEGHAGALSAVAFINGHARLLSASADGSVRLWDAEQAAEVRQLAPPGPLRLCLSDDAGEQGLVADAAGDLRGLGIAAEGTPWEAALGVQVRAACHPAQSTVVALGGERGQARLIDLRSGALLGAHGLGSEALIAVACDRSGGRLFALDRTGWLRGIDRVSGRRWAHQALHGAGGAIVLSADGQRVVCAGADGLTWLNAEDAAVVAVTATPLGTVAALAASADGRHLAVAGDHLVVLVDAGTRQVACTLRGHIAAVTSVGFNADGSRVVSASLDGTVRLWDVASGRCLLVLDAHPGGVRSAQLTGDDRDLITLGLDGRVLRWLALERRSFD